MPARAARAGLRRRGRTPQRRRRRYSTPARRPARASASLCAVWQDPSFRPEERAFYYARVLENPVCRWSTRLCNSLGVDCSNPGSVPTIYAECCSGIVDKTIQERAWTSPIFYQPEGFGTKGQIALRPRAGDRQAAAPADDRAGAARARRRRQRPHRHPARRRRDLHRDACPPARWSRGRRGGATSTAIPPARSTASRKRGLRIDKHGTGTLTIDTVRLDLSHARGGRPPGRRRSSRAAPTTRPTAASGSCRSGDCGLSVGAAASTCEPSGAGRPRAGAALPRARRAAGGAERAASSRPRRAPTGAAADRHHGRARRRDPRRLPADAARGADARRARRPRRPRRRRGDALSRGPDCSASIAATAPSSGASSRRCTSSSATTPGTPSPPIARGLALGLDREDVVVRNALVTKMRLLAKAASQSEEPTGAALERELEAYLRAHAAATPRPARSA